MFSDKNHQQPSVIHLNQDAHYLMTEWQSLRHLEEKEGKTGEHRQMEEAQKQ